MSLTRPQPAPKALRHTEWVLGAFDETGHGQQERRYIHIVLFSYVRGLAIALEPEAEAERETGITSEEWMESHEKDFESLSTPGPLTAFLQLDDFDFDLDKLFEFGLARLLDGLAVFQNQAGTRGSPARHSDPLDSNTSDV
jgi:hypothetical protein